MTPTDMYDAYCSHRNSARRRGIAFEFTLEAWCAWWLTDNRWANRGRRRDQYVMARRGDVGPYAADNVYLATQGQNFKDIPDAKRKQMTAKAVATRAAKPNAYAHLRRGAHHLSVKVTTPDGTFPSISAAAEHYGILRRAIRYRLNNLPGWHRS